MKKCYFNDDRDFSYTTLDEAVQSVLAARDFKKGQALDLWQADAIQRKASHYVPDISDLMVDQACDLCGGVAADWIFSPAQSASLLLAVQNAVDKWATVNAMHPYFFGAENAVKISVRFTDNKGKYEVLAADGTVVPSPDVENQTA